MREAMAENKGIEEVKGLGELAMVEFPSNPVSCLYHLFWAKVLEVFLHETFPPVKKATNFLVLGEISLVFQCKR